MGLGRTWIILGLIGSIACLSNAEPRLLGSEEDASLDDDNLSFLNSKSQKFASSATTIIENDHTLIYGSGDNNKITYNGHRFVVDHGIIKLFEGSKTYTFRPLGANVEKRQSIDFNGRPATVQLSNGNVFVYLPDGTVMGRIGNSYFVGDRYAVENRDRMIRNSNL
ncbi:GL17668 [Drosophila persimilis]|uniref:GL17668 n=1 Tax=Drosophila persimilis TaxID=7234 RepID=B4GI74_DROPE|nr:uncharacterized protein LOC6593234 [Drosophila persimilis]EDW36194.1 GL17668 [Drosophila persimilis]